jgi:uncharacterized protein (DUF305 family)
MLRAMKKTSALPGLLLLVLVKGALAEPPIINPGPPGAPVRELSADEAVRIAVTSFSPDDVRFVQDMIPHHHQALQMAELAPDRTNTPAILEAASRINASQKDEIAFMQQWLRERGQDVPDPAAHHAMHVSHGMAGMATPEQMAELAASKATAFDRLFLSLMIKHHEGAVKMVEELLERDGTAYDPVLFEFTSEITNGQGAEIERMHALLVGLSADPRAGLRAGIADAGQAIWNLELVGSLPNPPGFFDPENPGNLLPQKPEEEAAGEPDPDDEFKPTGEDEDLRYPLLSFANTDMAFAGDLLVTGSYHGFNMYRLREDGLPQLQSSVVCPGGQGDVSIVGNLLIMSVEETRGRVDCGLDGVSEDVSKDRFRGLRIFDISDRARPVQVGAVQTCRGSHTHSVISGPGKDGRIVVYNSGTAGVREEEEMAGCIDETPGDYRTALFRIDVIEIPVDDPGSARIVHSPTVFADPEKGAIAGLWRGGDHGDDTQETSETDQCHDITAFPALGIAAGACSGNGILFDISDPLNPRRIDDVLDKGFAYWHSATFNNDGTKVLFTDEWGGGSRPRCRAYDPVTWGADAIYDIEEGKLKFRSYFKLPAPQLEVENCVAHNGSAVPVPGRDIFVQAWYQGGISVIDFTETSKPVEIAYFDRGPIDAGQMVPGGYWSAYWYGGRIYGTEIVRGLDVFRLVPSEYLTGNEIAAAALADQGRAFNPQQQFAVTWPAEPVVALAYLDQLDRSGGLDPSKGADLRAALDGATAELESGRRNAALASRLETLAAAVAEGGQDAASQRRRAALAETLRSIAGRLRTA